MKRKPLLVLICILGAGAMISCGVQKDNSSIDNTSSNIATSEIIDTSETPISSDIPSSESVETSSDSQITSESSVTSSSEITSSSSSSSSSSEEPPVLTEVRAIIVDDYKLFVGNPMMSVDNGEYKEVEPNSDGTYTLKIGAKVRLTMADKENYVAVGANINGTDYKINANGNVNFVVEEDEQANVKGDIYIYALYQDITPIGKEYSIEVSNSAHITMHVFDETKKVEIDSVDMNDEVYIKVETRDGYKVKELTGYTVTDVSTGSKKDIEIKYKDADDMYYFKCPFSSSKKIILSVTEIDATAFAKSDILGDYLILRTYGLSGSDTYIESFTTTTLNINDAGEMKFYKGGTLAETIYASEDKDDSLVILDGNSTINAAKGNNLLVLGHSTSSYISPLSQNSKDICIALKQKEGTAKEDYVLKNEVFTINGVTYGTFNFYLNDDLYASCYITTENNKVYTDTTLKMWQGESPRDDKAVYDIMKGSDKLQSVGYIDEGGKGNRVLVTDYVNGYTNADHTLVFASNESAVYDGATYTVSSEDAGLKLLNPTKEVHITLNNDGTFTVVSEADVIKSKLDIANKVFSGKYWDNFSGDEPYTVNATVTFGDSNENITATILSATYNKYFWSFSATFNEETNILNCTITDRGYGGQSANTYPALGKQFTILLEDGKLTFKDDWTGNPTGYFKNCVFTCADFKL